MTQSSTVKLLDNAVMTADRYSQWIKCDHQDVNVHIAWVGTGTPVGTWKVELSNDPVIAQEKARIKNGSDVLNGQPIVSGAASVAVKVDISSSITPIFGTGFTVSGGTTGGTMFALTAGMARFFRVWFDHNSGGSAASLGSVWVAKV